MTDASPATDERADGGRAFAVAFAAAAVLTLLPLWTVRYVPMVDFPQYAAQIELWKRIADPAVAATFRLDLAKPDLGAFALGRLLAEVVPVRVALKLLVSLAALGLAGATLRLARVAGASPWWSLIAFPLAWSYTFSWGLLNFYLAVPLAVVLVAEALVLARRRTAVRAVGVAALALLLLAVHGLACAFALTVAGLVAVLSASGPVDAVRRLLPFVPAGLAGLAWAVSQPRAEAGGASAVAWQLGIDRVAGLPGAFLAPDLGPTATAVSWILFLLLASAVRLPATTGAERWRRLVPPLVALAAVLLGPRHLLLAAGVPSRLATFVPVFGLLLVPTGPPARWRKAVLLVVVAALAVDLGDRFGRFDAEVRDYEELVAGMEPSRRVLGLVFDRGAPGLERGSHLLHVPQWYLVEKGGVVDFSFAVFYADPVRYRDPRPHLRAHDLQWGPERFDVRRDSGYDAFVVGSTTDRGAQLFGASPRPVRLVARSGRWWLYEWVAPP